MSEQDRNHALAVIALALLMMAGAAMAEVCR